MNWNTSFVPYWGRMGRKDKQFTRLKELWEYNEDTVLINGTIFNWK